MPTNLPDGSTSEPAALIGLGVRVDRPTQSTALLFTGAKVPLFTVVNGPIELLNVIGTVTTVISNDASLVKLTGTPTTGTSVDLCANSSSVATLAVGRLLVITGTLATAMTLANAGGALWQAQPLIVSVGTIDVTGTVQGVTGAVQWSIWYRPLAAGAYVTSTI